MDEKNTQKEDSLLSAETSEKDWFLQILVNLANSSEFDFSFGITLLIQGFLVSGQLIGGRKYFNEFAKDLSTGFNNDQIDLSNKVEEIIMNMGNNIYDNIDKDNTPTSPTYIHLENAKFFQTNGNPIPGNKGILWRGRISEIGGFTFGILSSETK